MKNVSVGRSLRENPTYYTKFEDILTLFCPWVLNYLYKKTCIFERSEKDTRASQTCLADHMHAFVL